MEVQLIIEYLWILIVLIGLEGLLAADNAMILALMVQHLPHGERKKALFYGLAGAVVLRLVSLFFISYLINVWQLQAVGALYLLFISVKHLYQKFLNGAEEQSNIKERKQSGFWMTVLKVEIVDLAFAVDSILAAVALAVALKPTGWFTVGGLDGGQFLVIFLGGIIGVVIMRFAANIFGSILEKRPGLETSAYLITGWVGVKLALITLSHRDLNIISADFVQSTFWKLTFYIVLVLIVLIGWFASKPVKETQHT